MKRDIFAHYVGSDGCPYQNSLFVIENDEEFLVLMGFAKILSDLRKLRKEKNTA